MEEASFRKIIYTTGSIKRGRLSRRRKTIKREDIRRRKTTKTRLSRRENN